MALAASVWLAACQQMDNGPITQTGTDVADAQPTSPSGGAAGNACTVVTGNGNVAPVATVTGATGSLTIVQQGATAYCLSGETSPIGRPCSGDPLQMWQWLSYGLQASDGRCLTLNGNDNGNQVAALAACSTNDWGQAVQLNAGRITATGPKGAVALTSSVSVTGNANLLAIGLGADNPNNPNSQRWLLESFAGAGNTVSGVPLAIGGGNGGCFSNANGNSMAYAACDATDGNQRWMLLPWGGVAANNGACLRVAASMVNLASCSAIDGNQIWRLTAGVLQSLSTSQTLLPMIPVAGGLATNPPTMQSAAAIPSQYISVGAAQNTN